MAKTGKWLAMIGGLLILIQGIAVWMGAGVPAIGYWVLGATMMSFVLAVIFGILVLVGGWWSDKPGKMGAILALVFSIIALGFGGGWIIGSILGIIGGLMLWMKK